MNKRKRADDAASREPSKKLPFFARYLVEQELTATQGGANTTQKFPSDSDDED